MKMHLFSDVLLFTAISPHNDEFINESYSNRILYDAVPIWNGMKYKDA
jgi:hypothetical protein